LNPFERNQITSLKEYSKSITVSTVEKHPTGLEIYRNPNTKAVLIFLGWNLRPVRTEGMTLDEWWKNEIIPKYGEFERQKQYPKTIEEALASPNVCLQVLTLKASSQWNLT